MNDRNNGMDALDLPVDPDAQATVTDFLDFTEYLPSDMIRSLTLMGNLDQKYTAASINVNDLTKQYGALPTLAQGQKADPVVLRKQISENLFDAVGARTSSLAEATRMAENVDRHYTRAKIMLAKLQDMMEAYPSSREASPVTKKSPLVTRAPKITLRLGGEPKVRKHRAPRITVPGEVLAPFELDYESYGSSSSEEDEAITPRATPARTTGNPRLKLKIVRSRKDNEQEKTPRPPKSAGQVGTNAHSAVAGISTSNALALLEAPPEDAKIGSVHLPWLQLTAYELAILRKKMKKNAVWCPSDTMILRELKIRGRGLEAYRAAKADAEETGVPFDSPVPPQLKGETVHAEGAISVEALNLQDAKLSNRGMKLNEAKKAKRESAAKVAAKLAAEEMEQSARQVAEAANAMKSLFNQTSGSKTPGKPVAKTPARKRKREDSVEPTPSVEAGDVAKPIRPLLKRTKTETPIPVPLPVSKQNLAKQQTPLPPLSTTASVASELSSVTSIEAPIPSPIKKTHTPILPPGKERRVVKNAQTPKSEPTPSTRPQRGVAAVRTATPEEASTSKRPTSSRSAAAIEQATATLERPRRTSTARNTPAPPAPAATDVRPLSKRAKRPAPGVVTPGTENSNTTVTSNKRSGATRKKASAKKEKREGSPVAAEIYDEIDSEGNIIDPNEPRYCLCNRVSFGTMIGCESADVSVSPFCIDISRVVAIVLHVLKVY